MARIAGVDLPREKRIEVSLQYIYGIGKTTAKLVLERANVNPITRTKDLTDDEVRRIRETIDQNVKVEGDLRREVSMNIKRLMDLGCYRGLRHRKGLPVRGQRTHTNARTRSAGAAADQVFHDHAHRGTCGTGSCQPHARLDWHGGTHQRFCELCRSVDSAALRHRHTAVERHHRRSVF